jgi:hypothetical protein
LTGFEEWNPAWETTKKGFADLEVKIPVIAFFCILDLIIYY